MSSQQFIGILKEEYAQRKGCAEEFSTDCAFISHEQKKCPLMDRIACPLMDRIEAQATKYAVCGYTNHKTNNCWFKGRPKCTKCGLFSHEAKDCRRGKRKWEGTGDNGWQGKKDFRGERVNTVQEDPQEDEPQNIVFSAKYNNPGDDDPDVITTYDSESGETLSWYDWLADSAATSHVTNQRNSFKTYEPFKNRKGEVCGIGDIATRAEG